MGRSYLMMHQFISGKNPPIVQLAAEFPVAHEVYLFMGCNKDEIGFGTYCITATDSNPNVYGMISIKFSSEIFASTNNGANGTTTSDSSGNNITRGITVVSKADGLSGTISYPRLDSKMAQSLYKPVTSAVVADAVYPRERSACKLSTAGTKLENIGDIFLVTKRASCFPYAVGHDTGETAPNSGKFRNATGCVVLMVELIWGAHLQINAWLQAYNSFGVTNPQAPGDFSQYGTYLGQMGIINSVISNANAFRITSSDAPQYEDQYGHTVADNLTKGKEWPDNPFSDDVIDNSRTYSLSLESSTCDTTWEIW